MYVRFISGFDVYKKRSALPKRHNRYVSTPNTTPVFSGTGITACVSDSRGDGLEPSGKTIQ